MRIVDVSTIVLASVLAACASPNERVYEGTYTWGAEVEVFSSCRSGKTWWVSTSEPIWLALRDATQRLTSEPYEGIYVSVRGYYEGPASKERGGAFSTQYDGLFQVTSLLSARKSVAADCKA